MLLRSVTLHIKEQNWFAVLIDFLIVVVGVFIGIQVANWNASNIQQSKEQKILQQLQKEFVLTVADTHNSMEKNNRSIQANFEVLKVINQKTEPEDSETFAKTLMAAGRFGSVTYQPSTLAELLASGSLSDISSADLRAALVQFNHTMATHKKLDDLVLQRISTPHDGFHAAVTLQMGASTNEPFTATYDWQQVLAAREQFQVLYYGKMGLSTNMLQLLDDSESVLKELESVIKPSQ